VGINTVETIPLLNRIEDSPLNQLVEAIFEAIL
jgi:hypothetical protein